MSVWDLFVAFLALIAHLARRCSSAHPHIMRLSNVAQTSGQIHGYFRIRRVCFLLAGSCSIYVDQPRIKKSISRDQCGTVNYHPFFNKFNNK